MRVKEVSSRLEASRAWGEKYTRKASEWNEGFHMLGKFLVPLAGGEDSFSLDPCLFGTMILKSCK